MFKISHSILELYMRTLFEADFFQKLFGLYCMCTLIFWSWPTLKLASATPVCIRCAFPVCTSPKPLYYNKVTPTAYVGVFCEAKLLKISPLSTGLFFQLCPSLQEAKWIKKRQKIRTMDCSWWAPSSSLPFSKDSNKESLWGQCLHISLASAPLLKGSFAVLSQEVPDQWWFSHSTKGFALFLS